MTVMGQKWRLFGKIKIFGAGHKIAVGHHFGLDFVVFFTHLVEVFSQLTGSPQGSTGVQKNSEVVPQLPTMDTFLAKKV